MYFYLTFSARRVQVICLVGEVLKIQQRYRKKTRIIAKEQSSQRAQSSTLKLKTHQKVSENDSA